MTSQTTSSYANAASTEYFPTKEQAIIIDAIPGSQLNEYALAIAEKIPADRIRFISKISNNRVCVYLASKAIADDLTDNHKSIIVQGRQLQIRPLITKNQRIILSNVPPIIPHTVIENLLKAKNVHPTSQFTFLRAGMREPQISHLLSFRRQVYVSPDDVQKLPESLLVTFDETRYTIYIATDSPGCFICKQEGHLAKNCPTSNSREDRNTEVQSQERRVTEPLQDDNKLRPSATQSPEKRRLSKSSSEEAITKQTDNTLYPDLPSSSPDDTIVSQLDNTNFPMLPQNSGEFISPSRRRNRNKQLKVSETTHTVQDSFASIKNEMESNPDNYPLKFIQFNNLWEKIQQKQDINELSTEFKVENSELSKMFRTLYLFLLDRGSKVRFSKTIKKIESITPIDGTLKPVYSATDEDQSDYSAMDLEQ